MHYEVLKYDVVDFEVERVILYYESLSYDIGIKFEKQVEKALDKLETSPAYYLMLDDKKHRRIVIEGFPYAFIYCIEDNLVIVKVLFPQKEDPAKLWIQLAYLK